MVTLQQEIQLKPKSRGFHIITDDIINNFKGLEQIIDLVYGVKILE